MSIFTENEAKTKWCPLVRLVGFKDSDAEGTSWNRSPDDPVGVKSPATKCIASACMAWRKVGSLTVDSPNRVPGEGQTIDRSRGYCGAFGSRHDRHSNGLPFRVTPWRSDHATATERNT